MMPARTCSFLLIRTCTSGHAAAGAVDAAAVRGGRENGWGAEAGGGGGGGRLRRVRVSVGPVRLVVAEGRRQGD